MRPFGESSHEDRIDVAADAEGGMFVAVGADQNMMAASVIEVGGWAVRNAERLPDAITGDQRNLEEFLVPDEEKPWVYKIAEGVEVFFKHPVTESARKVVSPKVMELQPPERSS